MDTNIKDFIDKEIWLIPTGNFARRGAKPITAKVLKVGRVFTDIQIEGRNTGDKLRIGVDSLIKDGANGGYEWFGTREELDQYVLSQAIVKHILKNSNSYYWESLGYSKLKAIADILGVTNES